MTVSLQDIVLFVHIAAAIHLVGSTLMSPAIVRRVQMAATRAELLRWVEFFRRTTRLNPASAMVLLGTGIYLGSSGWWSSGWFYVAVFSWIVSSVLAAAVVKPSAARIASAAAIEPGTPIDGGLEMMRQARSWRFAEKVMLGGDVAILWIMVAKPGLASSIVALVATTALFIVLGLLVRPQAAPSIAQEA